MVVRLLFVSVFKPPGASLAGGVEAFACVITSALTGVSFLKVVTGITSEEKAAIHGGRHVRAFGPPALALMIDDWPTTAWCSTTCFCCACSSASSTRTRGACGLAASKAHRRPIEATCGMGLGVAGHLSCRPA